MRRARLVERMGDRKGEYRVWWGNLRKGDNLEDKDVDGRIMTNWVFKKYDEDGDWIDLAQDRES